jgi:hypothetical protein
LKEHDGREHIGPIAVSEIAQHIQIQLERREVFVTQRGYLVLGPRDAQDGGRVSALLEGRISFLE